MAGHAFSLLLTIGACVWLWHESRALDFRELLASLRALPPSSLAAALGLAIASHALYASFDLLGRRRTGMPLTRRRTLAIAWVAYAFSLALGPAGIALRFRLYLRHRIGTLMAAQVWAVTLAANWLGFVAVTAGVLLIEAPRWPGAHAWGPGPSRAIGAALLGVFIGVCWFCSKKPGWPTLPFVLLQTALSALNWLLIAATVWVLLPAGVAPGEVLAAVMANAAALAVVDVPAGIGVTEAVFVSMLGGAAGLAPLLAALAAYRVLYFLVPLGAALCVHLAWELRRPT